MVDFRDPSVIAQDYLALVKLWHAVDGLYIWEFFTTISYEWSILRGRRRYRWTIWIYSLTRVAALAAVIFNIVNFDVNSRINCQALIVTQFIFAYFSLAAASFLVVLRIIAIWNKNKVIMASAAIIWGTNVLFLIRGISKIRVGRSPGQDSCMIINTDSSKLNVIVTLVTEISLFIIMLFGLLRLRLHRGGTFALGRLLWKQGVIWFLLATLGEVPPTVFVCLNLNGPLNLIFQIPCLITMSIAATRMYRALADFLSSDISYESAQEDLTIPTDMRTSLGPTPCTRLEQAMYAAREEYPKPQMDMENCHGGPYIGMDEKLPEKRQVLSLETLGSRWTT